MSHWLTQRMGAAGDSSVGGEGLMLGDLFEEMKDAVEFAAVVFAGDDPVYVASGVKGLQRKALVLDG